MDSALVLFSGGQDSAIALGWALERFTRVETVGFDYGQRHRIELECRAVIREKFAALKPAWHAKLGDDHMIDLAALGAASETALTREADITFQKDGLPNTFVPGRNLLFFTYAAAVAYRRDIAHLVGGMCETDYSGYPDCRAETLAALEKAINLGMARNFIIHAPLMHIDKSSSWHMAEETGGAALVEIIRAETHSCYLGIRGTPHEWGHGCGACPACILRRDGYLKYRAAPKAA